MAVENGAGHACEEAPPAPAASAAAAYQKPQPSILTKLIGPISISMYLISLPVLAASIWLMFTRDYTCEDILKTPPLMHITIALGLLVVFVVSSLNAYYGPRLLLRGFMVVVIPLIVMFTVGLILVGAYQMENRGMPASPMWLQNRVSDEVMWGNIKSCVYDNGLCSELGFRTVELTSYQFSLKKLSPVESGCCKPPTLCEMEYVNATYWNPPKNIPNLSTYDDQERNRSYSFGDCQAWSNEEDVLCYDCNTCKEGFAMTLQSKWKRLGVFLVVMSLLLFLGHVAYFVVILLERYKTF